MPTVAEDLAGILSTVRRPGDFHASGQIEILVPRIEVDGVGSIALPLLPVQAEQLIAVAELAPYGRGPETLVDTAVRRAWQIGPDRVRIAGKHWLRTLDEIVARAAEGLGVSGSVAAELYKLLLYEEGGFFVSHRDTEKVPGMFATLVLALPSQSSGGELVVRHKGRETRLELNAEEPSEIAFAAFYADCVHEVLPVTSGHRATLVYNLVRTKEGARPVPPSYEGEAAETTARLQRWAEGEDSGSGSAPKKLIYPLEHAYTAAELDFGALKGADSAVAGVLSAAAPHAGCDLHLTLLTIEESGVAMHVGYSSSRWEEPDLEAGEVFERYETLSEWRRPDGEPSTLGELPIEENEICPPGALDDLEPDDEHFHEATGNEGASFERTYRRAALVLWPSEQALAVLNQAGLRATLPYLADLVTRWRSGGAESDSSLRDQALELAGHMLATWPTRNWHPHASEPSEMARMLSLLAQLGDQEGAGRLFATLIAQGGHSKLDNDGILNALGLYSPDREGEQLRRIVAASAATAPDACSALLAGALRSRYASKPAQLVDAVAALVEALPGDPSLAPKDDFGRPKRASVVDAGCIVDLVGVLDAVDGSLAQRTTSHLLAWPEHYGLDTVLVPAVRRLIESGVAAKGEALRVLHAACLDHLTSRVAEPLEPPRDLSRPSAISCKCEHCSAFGRFLADPEKPSWSLKAAEQIRGHLQGMIRSARSDVDVRTDRRGRPYTLICAKNQASYERRVAQRKKDLADIQALEK